MMKNIIIISCLLFGGCSIFDPKSAPPEIPDPTGATGRYKAEAEFLFGKARVLWKQEGICSDPGQAVDYLDRALEIEPDYAEALLRRGMALSQLGYQDDAFDDLTRSIRLAPTAAAYAARGLVLFRSGNNGGARHDLDAALRLDKKLAAAWNLRGALFYEEGNMDAACGDFARACSAGDCTGLEAARRESVCP